MNLLDQLCQVCGEPLVTGVVHCPRCATPHHADCWSYNGGCSIYGCLATSLVRQTSLGDSAPDAAESAGEPLASRLRPDLSAAAAFSLALAWASLAGWTFGAALLPALAAGSLAAGATALARSRALHGEPPPTPDLSASNPDPQALALEMKAVVGLLGDRGTRRLLHAYALFEQRHPRKPLAAAAQAAVALELLRDGHRALGLEAADKALRGSARRPEDGLTRERSLALAAEPAFFEETLQTAPLSPGDEEALLERHRVALESAWPAEETVYLASLRLRGFEPTDRTALRLEGRSTDHLPSLGRLLQGPLRADEGMARFRTRWAGDQPVAPVPVRSLGLPAAVERIREIHLSSREARFLTDQGERAAGWDQLRAVHYGQIGSKRRVTKEVQEYPRDEYDGRFLPRHRLESTLAEALEPVVELHLGDLPARLRLDEPGLELFRSLGRRRTLSFERNLVLFAKDLVRFAPRARFGHGLLDLLLERAGPGSRFEELADFEEYVLWFHALEGSPALPLGARP